MSKFYFEIPVPLEAAIKGLPKRASLCGLALVDGAVRVEWECDDHVTPYTFPVQWDGRGQQPERVAKPASPAGKPGRRGASESRGAPAPARVPAVKRKTAPAAV